MAATANDIFATASIEYSNSLVYGLSCVNSKYIKLKKLNIIAFLDRVKDSCTELDATKLNLYKEKYAL